MDINTRMEQELLTARLRQVMPLLLMRLRGVRMEIEAETGGLTEEQTFLFTDICQSLSMVESEVYYVVGETYVRRVTQPQFILVQDDTEVPWGDDGEEDALWDHVEHESGDPAEKSWALAVAEMLVRQGQWTPDAGDLVVMGDVPPVFTAAFLEGGSLVEGEHYRIVPVGQV